MHLILPITSENTVLTTNVPTNRCTAPAEYKQDSFDNSDFDTKPKSRVRQINIAGKMVELG